MGSKTFNPTAEHLDEHSSVFFILSVRIMNAIVNEKHFKAQL